MLQKITLLHLRNEEYHQFMTSINLLLLSEADLSSLNIGTLYPKFKEAHGKATAAIERIHKLNVSQSLAKANTEANMLYRGLVQQTYGKRNCALDPADQAAAEQILIFMKHYGNLAKRNMSERNSTFSNFVKDLREKCGDELGQLSLDDAVNQLDSASQLMVKLTDNRHDQRAMITGQRTMKDARVELDATYTGLCERINATLVLSGLSGHEELVEQINERIKFHKNSVAQRRAISKAAKKKASLLEVAEKESAVL